MIIICNEDLLCYIITMDLKYHDLPFGAQLLLWTSRVFIHGSCRTRPSKYDLVDIAFCKVGIDNGATLLQQYLYLLRIESKLQLQPICIQNLSDQEIILINCIEEHKKNNFDNDYYIRFWSLHNSEKLFTESAKNLALAFKKANLDTNLEFFNETTTNNNREVSNYFYKTLH